MFVAMGLCMGTGLAHLAQFDCECECERFCGVLNLCFGITVTSQDSNVFSLEDEDSNDCCNEMSGDSDGLTDKMLVGFAERKCWLGLQER